MRARDDEIASSRSLRTPTVHVHISSTGRSLFSLVATNIYFAGFDPRRAIEIQFSDRHCIHRAGRECGRIRLQMKVPGGGIDKVRVEKTGMAVISRGLDIVVESGQGGGRCFYPTTRLRSGGAVIKIAIDKDRRLPFVDLRSV